MTHDEGTGSLLDLLRQFDPRSHGLKDLSMNPTRNEMLISALKSPTPAQASIIRNYQAKIKHLPLEQKAKIGALIAGQCSALDCDEDLPVDADIYDGVQTLLQQLTGKPMSPMSGKGRKSGDPALDFTRMLQTQMMSGPGYRKTGCRKSILSFAVTSLTASTSGISVAQVAMLHSFKPERLLIPSDIAGQVIVQDLNIAGISQFNSTQSSSQAIPARVFTEVAIPMDLEFDLVAGSPQGNVVGLIVQNTSGQAVSFSACLYGTEYTKS